MAGRPAGNEVVAAPRAGRKTVHMGAMGTLSQRVGGLRRSRTRFRRPGSGSLGGTRAELAAIGVTLGADVPFFLGAEPALARGIGEQLTPVSIPSFWVAVLAPPHGVSTAEIFAAAELTRGGAPSEISVFSEGYGRNDLQPPAIARFPDISVALDVLSARSAAARMTGSGSCVFAPFATEAQAHEAICKRPPAMRGFVARTLARHPLAAFA